MTIAEITQPINSPVSLSDIKQHLRLDHTEDDAYLMELANAATLHVETMLRQKLINRNLRQYVDHVPASRSLLLEAWPVQNAVKLVGYSATGELVEIDSDQYSLQVHKDPAAIIFHDSLNLHQYPNGLEFDFTAGYGANAVDIPAHLSHAILALIAHWYEFRGTLPKGDETGFIPQGFEKLLSADRRIKL